MKLINPGASQRGSLCLTSAVVPRAVTEAGRPPDPPLEREGKRRPVIDNRRPHQHMYGQSPSDSHTHTHTHTHTLRHSLAHTQARNGAAALADRKGGSATSTNILSVAVPALPPSLSLPFSRSLCPVLSVSLAILLSLTTHVEHPCIRSGS